MCTGLLEQSDVYGEFVMLKKRIVDLGCGQDKTQRSDAEVIGVDVSSNVNADIVLDLNQTPYPFEDNEFDEIIMKDVIEHLIDIPSVMREVHRIGKPGAQVYLRTPHYSSQYAYNDPTHVHYLGHFALDCFIENRGNYPFYSSFKFQCIYQELLFSKVWRVLGISRLANKFPARWEQLFAFIVRAENQEFILRVIK